MSGRLALSTRGTANAPTRMASPAVYFYFAGIPVGAVLMRVALWRSRGVPRWLAALFPLSLIVAQQVPSAGIVIVVLLMLPFALAMVLLAARIWQAATTPASHSPQPTAVLVRSI
jgi:hypothetical protein